MKENLTIGSLVLINGVPRKVSQVTKHKIGYHLTDNECHMYYVKISEIKPIPLTAEILEKNGFKDEDEDADLLYVFYDGWNVEIHNKMIMVSCGSIWYVHQLQCALCLCGLNELADDFKI